MSTLGSPSSAKLPSIGPEDPFVKVVKSLSKYKLPAAHRVYC